jgi:hypothetical protein
VTFFLTQHLSEAWEELAPVEANCSGAIFLTFQQQSTAAAPAMLSVEPQEGQKL